MVRARKGRGLGMEIVNDRLSRLAKIKTIFTTKFYSILF